MSQGKVIVFANPVAGLEKEFNDWYSNVHLGEVIATPHVVGGQRFELKPVMGTAPAFKYAAVYDVRAGVTAADCLDDMLARFGRGEMQMDPSFDATLTAFYLIDPITPHQSEA